VDALADFFSDLVLVAGLLLAAVAAAPLLKRLRLPGPAAFLAVGIVAGLAGITPTEDLDPLLLEEIGAVALYAILFQGGLSTGFTAWRSAARPILLLGLPGTAATAAGLAAAAHFALGLDWSLAALIGIALSPTDPAAVYATLRGGGGGRGSARTVLEGESGINDPVGISLMVAAVAILSSDDSSGWDGVLRFVQELGIGLAGGAIGAAALLLLLRATPRLEEGLQSAAVLLGAVLVGAATASLHGSGFLAVYVTGLLIADIWAERHGRHHAVTESAAAIAEPLLFGLLGATFVPIVTGQDIWQGVVFTLLTVFALRPLVAGACLLGSGLSQPERVLVSWGGLKGAVPLLLAAYPGLEALAETPRVEGVVLVATAASIILQGATLSVVAGRIPPSTAAGRASPAARRGS
jgi:cell volume regulation protein A